MNPFIFYYTLEDAIYGKRNIEIRFEKENFCHLLGIETIVKKQVNQDQIRDYRGINGWNNIKNSNLNFQSLKKTDKKMFNNVKAKFIYFYLIPNLIQSPNAVNYDKNKVSPMTNIDCEILFHDTYNNAVIHLGIESSNTSNYYFPRSLFIEKISSDNDGKKFLKNQQPISITMTKRVILL